ncbi:acid sphingomyelinase-like phosphodiesterase 3a [Corticium candelabrum]|uniref:acid sphingomyelinase-like phosphodiesterase 3a n=1 Tax=Corticium candelabrum TaxID=121492 RepID=UPI002E25EC24|nr:acid sphingomyelinase-like phosphodiesterase 3a [Corticium candelabrum]
MAKDSAVKLIVTDEDAKPIAKSQHSNKLTLYFGLAVAATVGMTVLATVLAVTWVKSLPCTSGTSGITAPAGCAIPKSTFPEDWLKFFHISDVHIDPEYLDNISGDTYCRNYSAEAKLASYLAPYGRPNCDSPKLLMQDAFQTMKKISTSIWEENWPDFIVFTGDMAAHSLGTPTGDVVLGAITIATDGLRNTFPNSYVFPCLGNNDIPEDYYIPPHPQGWYTEVMNKWKEFVICEHCYWRFDQQPVKENEFMKTFVTGGYYKAQLTPKLSLLVLNTNYFSAWATVQTELFLETAKGQLEWLRQQLQSAEDNDAKVIISGHIPPGISTYGLSPLWFDNYTKTYLHLTAERYPHVIGGQLFGHIHRDDFRFFFAQPDQPLVEESSAILLTPSISPVYNNNPAFRLVYVDDQTNAFVDYKQWYLNMALSNEHNETHWFHEYTFSESYPSCFGQVINNEKILDITNGVISRREDYTWLQYIWHRQTEFLPDTATFSQNLQYCCMRSITSDILEKCKKEHPFIPG